MSWDRLGELILRPGRRSSERILGSYFKFACFSYTLSSHTVLFLFRNISTLTMSNPKVFFDITIGGNSAGRIVFEVRQLKIG